MAGSVVNYGLANFGVNVDKSEIELADGELREAQNAIPSPLNLDNGLTKRLGLLPITPDLGNAVLGGIGVPFALRVSAINGTVLAPDPGPGGAPGSPPPVGGAPAPGGAGGSGVPATGSGGVGGSGGGGAGRSATEIYWYRREASDGTFAATGLSQGRWDSNSNFYSPGEGSEKLRQNIVSPSPYDPTATLYGQRSKNLQIDGANYSPGENFATGTFEFMAALTSVAVLNNTVYFVPDSQANPITNVVQSVLCSFKNGGNVQQIRYKLPSLEVGHNTVILSLLAANAKIYFTVGFGNAFGHGAVYEFDPVTDTAKQLGASFLTGETPWQLCWHSGRVWLGTFNRSVSTPGNVYWFRPAVDGVGGDTAWTLDHAMTNGRGVTTMASFQGQLYVGNFGPSGENQLIETRNALGVWSTSDTIADDGLAHFAAGLITFGVNLYYVSSQPSGSAGGNFRKFNGTTWSTVATNAGLFPVSWVAMNTNTGVNEICFGGGGNGFSAVLFASTDGTTWVSRTANLRNSTGLGLSGGGVAVFQIDIV